jgi:hypothetical protein
MAMNELQEDYWADVVRSLVDPVSDYEALTDRFVV